MLSTAGVATILKLRYKPEKCFSFQCQLTTVFHDDAWTYIFGTDPKSADNIGVFKRFKHFDVDFTGPV